jgi:hypothetical protein
MSGIVANNLGLGQAITLDDGRKFYKVKTTAALTAGVPYEVTLTNVTETIDGSSVVNASADVAAVAAVASVYKRWGVPQKDYAIGDIAMLQFGGQGKAKVLGTSDVAAGNLLKIIPGTSTTALIYEGAAFANLTNSSVALAMEAMTTDATETLKIVNFLGREAIINT